MLSEKYPQSSQTVEKDLSTCIENVQNLSITNRGMKKMSRKYPQSINIR